ncbi:adenine nucleotide alpha hydrolases-like superfamily protein [Actinidia rufa]|uniref:Adenine nucleotide alpha hydrolases-like superfamily protein n=1 Tax=Actinidia rufa TaxID=165716 RepID=A0A7J0EPK9_9ERIC|nr:adenine nucleotide alpha hydrolases-like superfamily protein [Actinidia rufa]
MEEGKMRMKERRIVAAVDESEERIYALSRCLGNLLPENTKCTTFVLLYIALLLLPERHRDLTSSVMRIAEAVYRNFNTNASILCLPINVEKIVGTVDAKHVICIAVEKLGADILIAGSHDYGFFKRVLLGSVSDHCAKHIKCPLVIVKRPKNV